MNLLKYALITACLNLSFTALASPPADTSSLKTHKALLIGVDGMQYQKLQKAIQQGKAPNIAHLHLYKSYTGGVLGSSTQQPTVSGPGWTTILTGSWVDRHQVNANDEALRNQAPSLFKQLKLAFPERKTASIVSWNVINENFAEDITQGYIDLAIKCSGVDPCVVDKVSHELESGQPDLLFAHFDEPDITGHRLGFTPQYQQAIHTVDAQVGQILQALQQREKAHPEEDWLVIVLPDHGRHLPEGKDHGEQTLSEKTTFIAMNKTGNAQLSAPVGNPPNQDFKGLYGFASQADISPTVLAWLGVKPDLTRYAMDGLPLIGPVGVRQLTVQQQPEGGQISLSWRTDKPSGKPVQVYRDGQLIASLTDHDHSYIDKDVQGQNGVVNYTVVLHQVPVSRLITLSSKAP